jgi:hypothetical protein
MNFQTISGNGFIRFLTAAMLVLNISLLQGQVNFTAKLSSSKVGIRQQFTVTYSLTGARSEAFERPPFAGFRLTGQSSMTGGGSVQMFVNGQLVSGNEGEQSWTFTLMPTATGNFDIDPARVKVGGEWIESPSLKVSVLPSSQSPSPVQSQTQSQAQSGSKQQPPQQQTQQSQGGLSPDDVIIRAMADKSTAWVGEPVIITYRIFTKVSIPSFHINKVPSFDGFWSENLTDPNAKPQQSEEILNGQRYTSAMIRKIIVYPQRSGNLKLEPLEVELIARIARQRQQSNVNNWMDQMFSNFFGNPFGSDPFSSFSGFGTTFEDIKTTVKSNSISLNIKDLPAKNRTADFSGQVGKYSMEAWFDKDRILIDDALNLFVKISGNGNMSLLEPPNIQFPKSFDVFDPQVEDNTKTTGSGISGDKIFNYLIIPREPGKFTIPPVVFSYFDPSAGDYRNIFSDEFKLQIFGQQGSEGVALLTDVDQDIRFILLQSSRFRDINSFFFLSTIHILLFLLPLLAFFVFIILLRRHIRLHSNQQLLKYRRATKTAGKRLKKASALLKAEKLNEFYEETARAIWLYLSDRFAIEQAELSVDYVIAELRNKDVESETLESLKRTLEFCEYIRFAPGASSATPGEILQNAKDTVRNLEQQILQNKKNRK